MGIHQVTFCNCKKSVTTKNQICFYGRPNYFLKFQSTGSSVLAMTDQCSAINRFQNKPWFLCVCIYSFFKTLWEKAKWRVTSNFSFFHSVFYTFWEISAIFIKLKIVLCKLFQFGKVQNLFSRKGFSREIVFEACWMVFYAILNIISVISLWQLISSCNGFHQFKRQGLWIVFAGV